MYCHNIYLITHSFENKRKDKKTDMKSLVYLTSICMILLMINSIEIKGSPVSLDYDQ